MTTRTVSDSMGLMQVPTDALYSAQTARAAENFPVSGLRIPNPLIRSLGMIKEHAAYVNMELGLLEKRAALAIIDAAEEVVRGDLNDQFILDVFQTGSGTSTNMNANEVIATLASKNLGKAIHPNDQVNMGQSSNDVFPTAIHLAVATQIRDQLIPSLEYAYTVLTNLSVRFDGLVKVGRTHLQDAMPIRLGQVFSGYASQIELAQKQLSATLAILGELPLGGTAVGTGINTHPHFAEKTIGRLKAVTGLPLCEARNHFAAQGSKDALTYTSSTLKGAATALFKVANDIRFLSSGPRSGLGEINLPAVQPGSSIMPGKVNPVMAESLMQVCAQVVGNDAALSVGNLAGNFELNVMMPLMAHNLLQSIDILSNGLRLFTERCLIGITVNSEHCQRLAEQSLSPCTVLAPVIGYDKTAELAKTAQAENISIREVVLREQLVPKDELDRLLDLAAMTVPGVNSGEG